MITLDQARSLHGKSMQGSGGDKLGKIDTLYADREDGEPTFATVDTGMFGGKTHFVPLTDATLAGDGVEVPYGKDLVKSAPSIDPDAELSPEEEQRLYQHYGVTGHGGSGDDTSGGDTNGGAVGRDTSGPTTDDAMTRSEERLNVGTEQTETGRARLRKYVVTEDVQQTVPVSREEVRVEREPITDANAGNAMDGPAISEEEHEVVLKAERPVVEKEAVPVERVRLDKQTVTEQQQVSGEVRKEQIETDGS